MKLSMSIIAMELPYLTLEKGSGKMRFERCEILCTAGELEPSVLYLTLSEHIPAPLSAPNGGGVVCVGRVKISQLPGLEVLTVDESVDVISLVNAVNAIFHKYNSLELKLHEAVNSREDLRRIIRLAATLFGGNELFAYSTDFRMLAQSETEINCFKISGIDQPVDAVMPDEIVNYLKNDRFYAQTRSMHSPFIYDPGVLACPIFGTNIFYDNEHACRVILSGDKHPFRDHDLEMLGFVSSFVQQIYDTAVSGASLLPKNRLAELLGELIKGVKVDMYALSGELHRRLWQTQDSYICLCIHADTLAMMNKTKSYYCNLLNRRWEDVCAFQHDGWIACLVNLTNYGGKADEFFAQKVEQFRDMYLRMGVSDVFPNIVELHPSYLQSEIALRTGMKKDPQKWRYHFSDYSLDYVFDQMTLELDARHVASWQLRVLIDHDEQNKSEYCRTLYCYINSGMNAMRSARELYIHRTTMVYRLNRIQEMTGLDISNARELLYVHLSMVLLWDEMKRLNII